MQEKICLAFFTTENKNKNCLLQFTVSSGRHSVLERLFSEVNGRPFLVRRPPLTVC